MRRFFEILSIFNWVTPAIELGHQVKNTPKVLRGEGDEFNLFIKSKDYPQALVALERIGVKPKRKPVGFGIVGEYAIIIPYDELGKITSAFNLADVKYRWK